VAISNTCTTSSYKYSSTHLCEYITNTTFVSFIEFSCNKTYTKYFYRDKINVPFVFLFTNTIR